MEDMPELESLLGHCGLSSLGLVEAIDDTLVAVQGEEIAVVLASPLVQAECSDACTCMSRAL